MPNEIQEEETSGNGILDNLGRLDEYISILGKACENLGNQIEPVLVPRPPERENTEVVEDAHSKVNLKLQEICYTVGVYTKLLNDMADRVEL